MDPGKYAINLNERFRNLCFLKDGIIAYAEAKDDEGEIFRLFKFNY